MIVTPFGPLEFGNKAQEQQWIAAHGQRHRTYELRMSRLGRTLMPALLFAEPEREWIKVHYLHHVALNKIMLPDGSLSVEQLSGDPGDTEVGFHNWHRMHNLLHSRLDQSLGITP